MNKINKTFVFTIFLIIVVAIGGTIIMKNNFDENNIEPLNESEIKYEEPIVETIVNEEIIPKETQIEKENEENEKKNEKNEIIAERTFNIKENDYKEVIDTSTTWSNEYVAGSIEEFGGIANDGIDDTVAFKKALEKYKKIKLRDSGVYNINETLEINGDIHLFSSESNTATIIMNGSKNIIKANAPMKKEIVIKGGITKGTNSLTIDTKDISKGDLIWIKSNKLWYWDNRDSLFKGEVHRVLDVNDGSILLKDSIYDTYLNDELLSVYVYEESKAAINNIDFKYNVPTKTVGIETNGYSDSKYFNLNIENSMQIGLIMRNNYNSFAFNNNIVLNTSKDIPTGYGIQDYGGSKNKFSYNTISNVRRGIDISGKTPSHNALVQGNKVYGQPSKELATGSSGYGSHSTSVGASFKNNYSNNMKYGFVLRGMNDIVENNIIENVSDAAVEVAYGTGSTIKNNIYKGNSIPQFLYVFKGYTGNIRLINNSLGNSIDISNKKDANIIIE